MIKKENKEILVIQPYDENENPYTLCWIWAKDYTSVCYYYNCDPDVYCRTSVKEEVEEIQKKYPASSYYGE